MRLQIFSSIGFMVKLLVSVADALNNDHYHDPDNVDHAIQIEIHNEVKHQYDYLPFLRMYTNPDVTVSMIYEIREEKSSTSIFHETNGKFDLSPLHIVTGIDTFAGKDAIVACFNANPGALFIENTKRCTPLHYFWANNRVDTIVHLMHDLCINRTRMTGKRKRNS